MRYIKVPDPIEVHNPVTKDDVKAAPFTQFVEELLNDNKFCANIKHIDIAYEIQERLAAWKKNPEPYLALETAQWDLLSVVAAAPTGGYIPGLGLQMRPFIKAILQATETVPAPDLKAVGAAQAE